jgi:ADP-ribosylglycohydrolase
MEKTVERVKDRVGGTLLGLAAGDRNGGPIRMAVRMAESLADSGNADVEDIAARYLDWWHNGAFDTGPVAARVFTLVDTGLNAQQLADYAVSEAALETSLRIAGPANCCPMLVGSIGGTRWGADRIPEKMLGHCTILPRVWSAAAGLASRWVEGS